jgi:hypothetical protein
MKIPFSLYNVFTIHLLLSPHSCKHSSEHSSESPSIWKIRIRNGSDDGACHSGCRAFWTLQRTRRFGNWICFRPQVSGVEDIYSVESVRADPNHGATVSEKLSSSCSIEYRMMDRVQKPSNPEDLQSEIPGFKPTRSSN